MIKANSLGYKIDNGERVSVHCEHANCPNKKTFYIDLEVLAERLGRAHPTLHWDLEPYFGCQNCTAAGRPKKIGFISHTNTSVKSTNP